jgi:hypothetical protein
MVANHKVDLPQQLMPPMILHGGSGFFNQRLIKDSSLKVYAQQKQLSLYIYNEKLLVAFRFIEELSLKTISTLSRKGIFKRRHPGTQ